MSEFLIQHVHQIHIYEMVGMGILISLLECIIPLRPAADTLKLRWVGNLALMILSFLIVGIALPMFGYGWASYCEEHGWGLFHHFRVPGWFNAIVTFLALDLLVYGRHRLAHTSSLLWRMHRLHHTDNDIDFTTTFRFHPLDALLIIVLEGGLIALLGASAIGVVAFRLISTIIDFTSHANVKLPAAFDRLVRRIVITPYMHRIHHSQKLEEGTSNYGNVLPIWDRVLGTYLADPADGYVELQPGLAEFTERKHQSLPWMLAQPFLSDPSTVRSGVNAVSDSQSA